MQHPFPSYLARSWSAINLTDNLLRKSVASFTNSLHSILVTIPGSYFVRLAYKRPEPVADTFLRRGLILAKKGWGGANERKKMLEGDGFRTRQRVRAATPHHLLAIGAGNPFPPTRFVSASGRK